MVFVVFVPSRGAREKRFPPQWETRSAMYMIYHVPRLRDIVPVGFPLRCPGAIPSRRKRHGHRLRSQGAKPLCCGGVLGRDPHHLVCDHPRHHPASYASLPAPAQVLATVLASHLSRAAPGLSGGAMEAASARMAARDRYGAFGEAPSSPLQRFIRRHAPATLQAPTAYMLLKQCKPATRKTSNRTWP